MTDGQTVLVVSSDDLFREAAAAYLRRRGWRVSTAADGLQALVALPHVLPIAVLLLGGPDRHDPRVMVRQIVRRLPRVRVIVLGSEAVEGAHSLARTATASEVVDALEADPAVAPAAAVVVSDAERPPIELLAALTARERRILLHLAAGLTRAEIAVHMHVSEHTVRTHQQNLHRKLGVHSRLELMRFASRIGLLASVEGDGGRV